jgi:TPR repeat protein
MTRRSLDHLSNDVNQAYPHNGVFPPNGFAAGSANSNVGSGSPNMGASALSHPRPARMAPLEEPLGQPRQRDTQAWDNASSVGDQRRPRSQYPEHLQQQVGNNPQWASQSYPDQPSMYDDPQNFLAQDSDPFYGNAYNRNESPMYGAVPPPDPRNPSPAMMDQSHLQPGTMAALLSNDQSMAMYRANARKNSNPELVFEFAAFMLEASKSIVVPPADSTYSNQLEIEKTNEKRESYVKEATSLLKKIADRGHVLAQYTLADCFANGIGTVKGRQDFDRAFPLFVSAAKHNHVDAAYRAGACCEYGWGCRKDSGKAVQFYKKAAAQQHPGALFRLGQAEMNGELGLSKNSKEGVKFLKRSAENATAEFPHALHELALCHEKGVTNVIFVDLDYAAELLAQAAELGYAPSAFRLGECYEYGTMGCPQDPALSIHYYVRFNFGLFYRILTSSPEYCRPTRSSRCLLFPNCLVSRWLSGSATPIRHGSLPLGKTCRRRWPSKGSICSRLLLRNGYRHRTQ